MSITATSEAFAYATTQEGALNERQREVLRLVAAGKTNPEIAETLGMTLDGAKWNVSEILSKLGLSGREEAAAYYHWRRRPAVRLRRAVGGLAGLLSTKWLLAGGAGAVVVVATVAGLFALGKDGSREASGQQPFYLEATFEVRQGRDPLTGELSLTSSTLKWWWQDTGTFRYEVLSASTSLLVVARDGEWLTYDELENSYSHMSAPNAPAGTVFPPTFSVLLGPYPQPAGSLDAILEGLRQRNSASGAFAQVVREETLDGRRTLVVHYGPLGTSSDGAGNERSHGSGEMWVDPNTLWIIRHTGEDDEFEFDAKVTKSNVGARHDGILFAFTPPPDAVDTGEGGLPGTSTTSGSGATLGGGGEGGTLAVPYPVWALRPGWLPDGLAVEGYEAEMAKLSGGPSQLTVTLKQRQPVDERIVQVIQQIRPSRPPALPPGLPVEINGLPGTLSVTDEITTLAWVDADVAITIRARGLTEEDILRIAREMRRGP